VEEAGTRVEFVRVPYEVDEAADAIRVSDLPEEFAEVLKSGGADATTSSAAS
jgi:hypothetical protein